jgi:hypothetical protein
MSVHDYFKPLAPKQSKKDIWQICIPYKSKAYPVRLPKVLQEKTYDLKSSVSIISLPTQSSAKDSKKIELFQQPVRSKAFKVTRKLLKKSGIKPDPPDPPLESRQKSKETRIFIKQEIFQLEHQKFRRNKACNTQEYLFEGLEKGRVSFDNIKSCDYLKLESVRSYESEKSKVSTSVNKRRNSLTKEPLSLPVVSKDEFELKGW